MTKDPFYYLRSAREAHQLQHNDLVMIHFVGQTRCVSILPEWISGEITDYPPNWQYGFRVKQFKQPEITSDMDRIEIERINKALNESYWGEIDSDWFEYIDLSDNLAPYDEFHIEFQRILQNKYD